MAFSLGLAALTLSGPLLALDVKDLSFYAPFDDSLDAAVARGDGLVQKGENKIQFIPGISGSAVLLGEKGDSLSYAVENNISEQQGAISVWINPLFLSSGWNKQRSFLWVPNGMHLWYSAHALIAFTASQWYLADYPTPLGGKNTTWHHLVINWGKGECSRYEDGEFESKAAAIVAEVAPWATDENRFRLADPSADPQCEATATMNNKVAFDELMIFNGPLTPVEIRSLYQHGAAKLSKPVLSVGEISSRPKTLKDWSQTAKVSDFVDQPFGNLSAMPVRANLAYYKDHLLVLVRTKSATGSLELQLIPKVDGVPFRFLVTAEGARESQKSGKTFDLAAWEGRAFKNPETGEFCFEVAIPWKSLEIAPTQGASLDFNILRRFSTNYGDVVSWMDLSPVSSKSVPYGAIVLAGKEPVLALKSVGRLQDARLDLVGEILNPSSKKSDIIAEVRLQPSDLKETVDPALGTRSLSGSQLNFDQKETIEGTKAQVKAGGSFSDQSLNSLWLKITDGSNRVLYQVQRPFVPQPPIFGSVKLFPSQKRVEIHADISNFSRASDEGLRGKVSLLDANGKLIGAYRIDSFKENNGIVKMALDRLPQGRIRVKTSLNRKKNLISEHETEFEKLPLGPWYGNKLGKDDIVIPPFTPVKIEGQSVSVWGRTYKWSDSLFPVQITSGGNDLLASPIELLAGGSLAGKASATKVRIVESTDTHAIVECRGTIADVPVTARHRIEYDGMCWTQLEIRPGKTVSMEGLSLYIPFMPQQASLYHYVWSSGSTKKLTANGKKAEIGLRATVWLGNEDCGVTWFTESNIGWRLGGKVQTASIDFDPCEQGNLGWKIKSSAQCISDEGKAISLTVRFADQPFELSESLSLSFGLIATPVKQMQAVHHLHMGQDLGLLWNGLQSGFMRSNNDIANILPGFKDRMMESCKKHPQLFVLPYVRPDWVNLRQPEWNYFKEDWLVIPPLSIMGSDDGGPDRHGTVCLGSSQWQDFMVYYMMKAYDENNMNGYYFDEGRYRCANELHGHRGEYPILAIREFHKRLAVEFTKRGRPYQFFIHASGNIEMPAFSFASMIWSGEEYSASATIKGYHSLFSLDSFRAEFLGQQFGIPIQMLNYFKEVPLLEKVNLSPEEAFARKSFNAFMELVLLHGTTDLSFHSLPETSYHFTIYKKQVLDALDQFGCNEKDAQFLPYWKNSSCVKVSPANENLACSLWQRPGKILAIVGNNTQEDQQTSIRLDLKSLGLGSAITVRDTKTDKILSMEKDILKLDVESGNWRMVLIENIK